MKKSNISYLALFLVLGGGLSSCHENCLTGKGEVIAHTQDIGAYSAIKLKVPATVYLEQNASQEVKVEAQNNINDNLTFRISEEVLIIDSKRCIGENKGISIYLKTPTITKLTIEGSGNINGQGIFNTDQLELAVKGSGDINVKANAGIVFAGTKGSGNIVVAGTAQKQYIKIDGSGNYNGSVLPTVKSDVYINGSGEASVHTIENLFVNIAGSGNVKYKGNPKVSSKIEGSGQLIRVD